MKKTSDDNCNSRGERGIFRFVMNSHDIAKNISEIDVQFLTQNKISTSLNLKQMSVHLSASDRLNKKRKSTKVFVL